MSPESLAINFEIYGQYAVHAVSLYQIRSNFQMTKFLKKSAVKDFENNIFEKEARIQLAIIW